MWIHPRYTGLLLNSHAFSQIINSAHFLCCSYTSKSFPGLRLRPTHISSYYLWPVCLASIFKPFQRFPWIKWNFVFYRSFVLPLMMKHLKVLKLVIYTVIFCLIVLCDLANNKTRNYHDVKLARTPIKIFCCTISMQGNHVT